MASPSSHKRQHQEEPTTLMPLGDDMLAEILTRLPSLPLLARAAFACLRLRDVATSPLFTSRFVVSPAPLLGYFVSAVDADIPSFHRALLLSDRDVATVIRRGDFCLSDFDDFNWRLMDSRQALADAVGGQGSRGPPRISGKNLKTPNLLENKPKGPAQTNSNDLVLSSTSTSSRPAAAWHLATGRPSLSLNPPAAPPSPSIRRSPLPLPQSAGRPSLSLNPLARSNLLWRLEPPPASGLRRCPPATARLRPPPVICR
jgi:hypothetical protein